MMQRWLLMFHGGGNHAKRTEHSRDIIKKICSDQLTKRAAENRKKKKLSKPNYPRQRCPHTLWSQLRKNAEQCKELFIWQNASRP